jgi:hypothetical protein
MRRANFKTKIMSETRIKIKELEMNGETAIRIAECLKKHEPEIWKVLSGELKQALRIHDVSGRSEQLLCGDLIKHNFSLSKIGICYECKFIKDRAK